jgi:type VI secretion system protein ImpJ
VISSRYFAIALREVKPSYHHGMLDSGKIDDKTTFYIAVSAAMPASELVDVVPLRFKVGAPDDVDNSCCRPCRACACSTRRRCRPPCRCARRVYFSIEAKGQMYERMLQAQSISIYVPAAYATCNWNWSPSHPEVSHHEYRYRPFLMSARRRQRPATRRKPCST